MATSEADAAEIARLTERVRLAETVCTLYGWTASAGNTSWDKALTQAWMNWAHAYGSPEPTPEWDLIVMELAAERDRIRTATLTRIRDAKGAPDGDA